MCCAKGNSMRWFFSLRDRRCMSYFLATFNKDKTMFKRTLRLPSLSVLVIVFF